MKKKNLCTIAILLLLFVIFILIPVLHSISDKQLLNKTETGLYEEMSQLSSEQLIRKINHLEKNYQTMEEKTALLPLYTALTDRAEFFSSEELIDLICKRKTLSGIDSAFVEMFVKNGYDIRLLLQILNNTDIADEVKVHIVSMCDFSVDELSEIIRNYDGEIVIVAIKKIAVKDSDVLSRLINVSSSENKISDEKQIAICLAIAGAYEDADLENADNIRKEYTPVLMQIYQQSNSELVQDQVIYALGRICDNESFTWIIENDSINKYTKISVIERNNKSLISMIESATTEDDISSVIKAMKILPVLDIADSLENAINIGKLPQSDELNSLIEFIRKEGIEVVDKYEK